MVSTFPVFASTGCFTHRPFSNTIHCDADAVLRSRSRDNVLFCVPSMTLGIMTAPWFRMMFTLPQGSPRDRITGDTATVNIDTEILVIGVDEDLS